MSRALPGAREQGQARPDDHDTRMRTAAARRTPSLPRRRRWPLPTGANMAERQPRSGGEDLGLLALDLVGCDNSAVTQVAQLGQLVGRRLRTRGLLDIVTEFPVLLLRLPRGPLVHLAAAGDQVDQDTDQRDEQHEQEPQRLRPTGQVMAAEDIDEDIDQNPDP